MPKSDLLEIDGSMGEGGGQVLRSSLTLSILTRQAFALSNIRSGRGKPGLRAQHLAAARSAARICGGILHGDRIGSGAISFKPGRVAAGDYLFDIGTAGATSLVLQTLLPPLALAAGSSTLAILGGTHVPWSPCFHYLDWNWRPLLARVNIEFDLELRMAGFYPRGGGRIEVRIPGGSRIRGLRLTERGRLLKIRGLSAVADLPADIAERQRKQAEKRLRQLLGETDVEIDIGALPTRSPGTLLLLRAEFEQSRACFFALGARGKRAETVADEAVGQLAKFLATGATLDHFLADQLLLPLALAEGGSEIVTSKVTPHLLTNAEVIRRFLPVRIAVAGGPGYPALVRVEPVSG